MPKLPKLSDKEVVKALSKTGFEIARQKGNHVIMRKKTSEGYIVTVVPNHKEVDRGTLIEIIRQAKLKRDEFMNLL